VLAALREDKPNLSTEGRPKDGKMEIGHLEKERDELHKVISGSEAGSGHLQQELRGDGSADGAPRLSFSPKNTFSSPIPTG
jgi:hypothetical protein